MTDTSFDASKPTIAERRSGSARAGFYRPGERSDSGAPFKVTPTKCPNYNGPPSGRTGNAAEKRGAWHLEDEYLAGRLGKNEEENGRLWNTAKWIERHNRIETLPKEAIQPLNIRVDGSERMEVPEVDRPDGGFPDDVNLGYGYKQGIVDETDKNNLNLKIDDYRIGRLIDELEEIDKSAKFNEKDLLRTNPPLPQVDFPDLEQRVESGKIIRILKVGMQTLWYPVIRAIESHATMTSLGRSQGVGEDKAATVGRWRVIEGLRLAESIRRRLERQKPKAVAKPTARRHAIPSVSEMMGPLAAPKALRAPASGYLNQVAGPVIKREVKPLHANDNRPSTEAVTKAA
jgi:hypothetical protein